MKAWTVCDKWDDDKGSILTWADTATGAKNAGWELDPDSWIDLRVHRCPWADDMEDVPDDEMMIRKLEAGWRYWDYMVYPDLSDDEWDKQRWVTLDEDDAEGIRAMGLDTYLHERVSRDNMCRYIKGEWKEV